MGKPVVKRTLKLDFLGDEWKECYIRYTRISMKEILGLTKIESTVENEAQARKVFDFAKNLMAAHFIDGVGYMGDNANGEPVIEPLTVENVSEDLFTEIYVPFIKVLRGTEDANL